MLAGDLAVLPGLSDIWGRPVWSGPALVSEYVALRAWCTRTGHGLGGKEHEADRWIAATARWLEVPLISDDHIFEEVDGVELLTA